MQRRRQLRRRRHPGDRGDEAGHLRLVQAAKQQPAAPLPAGQVRQGPKQRVAAVHLGVPVAAHHQRAGALQLPAHEPQQRQRRRIRPVRVVQHQQQRPPRGGRPQEAGQAVKQPEAGRLRLGRGGVGRPGRHSPTAGTSWATSAAPAPMSRRSVAGSAAWT
jgi:hypothetical protein